MKKGIVMLMDCSYGSRCCLQDAAEATLQLLTNTFFFQRNFHRSYFHSGGFQRIHRF